jgi:gastricsin
MAFLVYGLQYMVDCSSVNNLPTLSFVISGVALPLPPSAYIAQVPGAVSVIAKH